MQIVKRWLDLIEPGARRRWLLLVFLALLASALEVAGAGLTVVLLRAAASGEPPALPLVGEMTSQKSLVLFLVGSATFFGLRAALVVLQAYAQHRITTNAGVRLSGRLHRGYLDMPYEEFVRRNSSELIRNAQSSVELIVRFGFLPAVAMAADTVLVLAIVTLLFVLQPVPTLLGVCVLVLVILPVQRSLRPRLLRLGRDAEDMSGRSLKALQQSLQGIREVKLSRSHEYFLTEYVALRARHMRAYYLQATLEAVPRTSVETAFMFLVLAFMAFPLIRGDDFGAAVPALGLFAYAVLRIMPAMNRILSSVNYIKYGSAAVANVHQDLMAGGGWRAARGASPARPHPRRAEQPAGRLAVEFRDVSYTYPGSTEPALRGLSFAIERGEYLGVVGPTGCGKSTLVDLVLGLLQPTSGAVLANGVDLRESSGLRHVDVGVVSQTVFLIDDTLRRNIAFGIDDADVREDLVQQAVALAGLEELLVDLPGGLDTVVGERGVRLSGGQRQRISIARALYRAPSLLVLDEGTSALDNVTEAGIMRAIDDLRGSMTIVSVAHRLSTVQSCDRILLLKDGAVVDIAPFRDLVERHDFFRQMLETSGSDKPSDARATHGEAQD